MRAKALFLSLVFLLIGAVSARADVFTFTGNSAGGPVSVKATFTVTAGFVDIKLENLTVDPANVGQNLSDLGFTLSGGQTTGGSLTSSSGVPRTVAADGTFTDGAAISTGWGFLNAGQSVTVSGVTFTADRFFLEDLGFAGPANTILGLPAAGGTYASANCSIAGNGPHNPMLASGATFHVAVSGLTADEFVTSATFSFGTSLGDNHFVPEPGMAVAALGGLSTLGLLMWRRRTSI